MIFMALRQVLSNFELIAMMMQKRIKDLAIERAYLLADMAVRGEIPDERFSEKECEVWNNYRFWVEFYKCSEYSKEEL